MKKIKLLFVFLVVVILSLSIFTFVLLTTNKQLEENLLTTTQELEKLKTEYNEKSIDYQNLTTKHTNLNQKHANLESDFNSLVKEHNQLFLEHEQLIQEYEQLDEEYTKDFKTFKEEINEYVDIIEEKMTWFKENSIIDQTRIQRDLRNCVDCSRRDCIINVACIDVYVNNKRLNLEYSLDYKDILQDIPSFIDTKKGDCKEYSLLFAAHLRYLIKYIKDQEKIPIIEAITKVEGASNYSIYDNWIYPEDIDGYQFGDAYYPYVVCGEIYDPQQQKIANHCLLGITDKQINNVSEIEDLDQAFLLEPQNAFFIDKIEYKEGVFYGIDSPETKIHVVITSEDIFLNDRYVYNEDNYRWHNYKDFHIELLEFLENQD